MNSIKKLYDADRRSDVAGVYLPDALARKYPAARTEWGWFWVFPSRKLAVDPHSVKLRRHHLHSSGLRRNLKTALAAAGIAKPANVQTTMIYTHVARPNWSGVKSPLDRLP